MEDARDLSAGRRPDLILVSYEAGLEVVPQALAWQQSMSMQPPVVVTARDRIPVVDQEELARVGVAMCTLLDGRAPERITALLIETLRQGVAGHRPAEPGAANRPPPLRSLSRPPRSVAPPSPGANTGR